ncbi:hypothetical protein MASR2M41_02940 [Flammeovirgaceae bacterium]
MANYGKSNKLKRKAFELKQMQNFLMWQGSVVDKIMETLIIPEIVKKEKLDFHLFAEEAVSLADQRFAFSKKRSYMEEGVTKTEAGDDFCILNVHELEEPYTTSEISKAYQNIRDAIISIPDILMPDSKTSLLDYLKEANALYPNVTNRQIEIETANVKPQIDLVLYDKMWKPVIMDWKVSDSWTSDYSKQLVIIGLVIYLKRLETPDKPAFKYEEIKLYEVNLLKGIVKQHEFTEDVAAGMIDEINLTSSDIKLIREDIKENNLTIEDFDTTDNQSTCKFCNYATLCSFLIQNKFQYDENAYLKFIQDKQFT